MVDAETYTGGIMWYVIIAQDAPNSLEQRMAHRPAHIARLQSLLDQGRLLLERMMELVCQATAILQWF